MTFYAEAINFHESTEIKLWGETLRSLRIEVSHYAESASPHINAKELIAMSLYSRQRYWGMLTINLAQYNYYPLMQTSFFVPDYGNSTGLPGALLEAGICRFVGDIKCRHCQRPITFEERKLPGLTPIKQWWDDQPRNPGECRKASNFTHRPTGAREVTFGYGDSCYAIEMMAENEELIKAIERVAES